MIKWFEQPESEKTNIISSRIRLVRNWEEYRFPANLPDNESMRMVTRLQEGLREIKELDGRTYNFTMLGEINELDRMALRERRVINSNTASKKAAVGLILSENEDTGIVLNGDDHIRIQLLATGLKLEELWERADKIDDYVNRHFAYAFDERYGYLTSFPTNVGTGLRASVVIHLPTLSLGRKFTGLLGEMSRFGTKVKGVYGEGSENYGSLYEISNQKTLGQSEEEIVDLVGKIAGQLTNQEGQVRKMSLQNHKLERADEAYKSYGVLKYARRLSSKDAMIFLSQLMAGIADGLVETREPCSVYRLMLGIQTANLQKLSDRPLSKEELDVARARYLREELPEIK